MSDCATLWTVACQASLSMESSRQEYWSGLPCPPPGDHPNPGTEPVSLMSPALAYGCFTTSDTWEALPWNRKWQPTLVFLPGKLQGQRNLGATGVPKSQTGLMTNHSAQMLTTGMIQINKILWLSKKIFSIVDHTPPGHKINLNKCKRTYLSHTKCVLRPKKFIRNQ